MRFLAILLGSGLALTGCTSTQPYQPATYDAALFFDSITYKDLSLAHNGRSALISSDQQGSFGVYKQPLSGAPAQPLVANKNQNATAISWFPHDQRFLFEQDGGGDEMYHIYVADDDGQHDLIKAPQARGEFVTFTNNGRYFFLLTNERDPRKMDLYRYDAKTYQRQRVFNNEAPYNIDAISQDGRYVALSKINNNADTDLYLADLNAPQQAPVRIGNDPHQQANFVGQTFGPNGKKLYYTTDAYSDYAQVWSYDLTTHNHQQEATAAGDITHFRFSHTGRYELLNINHNERLRIQVIDTNDHRRVELDKLPSGNITDVRFNRDDSTMVFYRSADTSPRNLYRYNLDSQQIEVLTFALNTNINAADLVAGQSLTYPSTDELSIPAILYQPIHASADHPRPVLVWIHGGPGGQTRHGYHATIQYLVNHGYGVLAVNNRGSNGYGKAFYHLDDRHHGEGDLQDIINAKAYLSTLPWVKKDSIAVLGRSYGGYLAVAALAFHPEVFAAGIDVYGVTNWPRTLAAIPPWWEVAKRYLYSEMGDPNDAKDKARLRRISPLFNAASINKPLLVMQGANDPRVLPRESKELVDNLQQRAVPVHYVELPGEGHGFRKKASRIKAATHYLHFLQTYLP